MYEPLPASASILVVDDNPNNLELLRAVLEQEGHSVHMENDGLAALRAAQDGQFDLALIDVRMPRMNGYELCELLKADPRTRHMPVIFLSALSDVTDKIAAFESGGIDYIVKPFKVAEVVARVATQLKVSATHRRLASSNEELRKQNEAFQAKREERAAAPTPTTNPLAELEARGVLDGKYELAGLIGHGGFGVVYRGRHLVLDRPVAIKLIRTGEQTSPGDAERFRMEGVSACRVDHPNAVLVLDAGMTRTGLLYLVMELLEGRSMRAEIAAQKRMNVGQCVRISERIASVLAAAHAKGVIHRDVKPDNVFLHVGQGLDPVVKVVDFGIAKLMSDPARTPNTARGMMVGTPEYLAPERLLSRPYDGRADVYALGCTMFEAITGRPPFVPNREAPWLVAASHIGDPAPPIVNLEPSVPMELAALIHAALEKDPDDRPTAAQFQARLAEILPLSEEGRAAAEDRFDTDRAPELVVNSSATTLLHSPQGEPWPRRPDPID